MPRSPGTSVYPSDLTPPWPLILLVAVLVPVLTVGASWIGMRATIVEPLGVVRRSTTVRRKGWWRVLLVLAGVILMVPDLLGLGTMNHNTAISQSIGAVVLIIGVPVIMPWLTERIVSALNGRTPAAQLAIRRLQLDSGTPTRVVAGVVVVLAGAIALQTMFGAVRADIEDGPPGMGNTTDVRTAGLGRKTLGEISEDVARVEGVRATYQVRQYNFTDADSSLVHMVVGSCAFLSRSYHVPGCSAGDAFAVRGSDLREGSTLTNYSYADVKPTPTTSFPLPELEQADRTRAGSPRYRATVLMTPAAARGLPLPETDPVIRTVLAPEAPDTVERIRNVLAPIHWSTSVCCDYGGSTQAISKVKNLLYIGAVFTMLLAAVSLLVAATQQVADRRRALAAMNASGVPTGVLARSLLWQNAIPMSFGVLVASGIGLGVSWLAVRKIDVPFTPDWMFIASITVSAVVLVLAVTAATLPALRSATRLDALRAE